MRIAIIPARGGSKRIPRKNIKEFWGKPLIVWSIETLRNSGVIDRVIVSTDDQEISEIALSNGAEVPFIRPLELSDDFVPTLPVISHALKWLENNMGYQNISEVCCMYPAAPFVTEKNIVEGLELLLQKKVDYVVPVSTFDFPIQRALSISNTGCLSPIDDVAIKARSQDLEVMYHDAGQFYWGTKSAWILEKPVFGSNSIPLILQRNSIQDIDTPEDFELALRLFSRKC